MKRFKSKFVAARNAGCFTRKGGMSTHRSVCMYSASLHKLHKGLEHVKSSRAGRTSDKQSFNLCIEDNGITTAGLWDNLC